LNPLRILQIPSPEDLYAVIVHQQIEIKTSEARSVLPAQIKLKDATTQWANLGSLIHALHTNDYALIGECLEDVVAEPYRSKVIPAYEILKKAAKTAGALGTSISGSGPSIFSLCKGIDIAKEISSTQKKVLNSMDVSFEVYISKINTKGVSIL
jgi:homoserine kinase